MKKILAICIPTYNRSNTLNQLLNDIFRQLNQEYLNYISIHVFDNDSIDNTKEICLGYLKKYPMFFYHRNETNLGPDGNFLKILRSNLNANFYHLMSDDDAYKPGSLVHFIDFLKQNLSLDFVYLNIQYFYEDKYDSCLMHKSLSNIKKNQMHLSKEKFVNIVQNELSFLSGMVFNSKCIDSQNLEMYVGSNWLQTYCLFQSLKKTNIDLCFYGDDIICKRESNEPVAFDVFKVFGENYFKLFEYGYSICNFSKYNLLKLLEKRWCKIIYWSKCNNISRDKYSFIEEKAMELNLKKVKFMLNIPSFIPKIYFFIKHIFKK